MTPEAQRIAIAEACGWKLKKGIDGHSVLIQPNGDTNCSDPDPQSEWTSFEYRVPDYLNDLNAMHEAEKVLNAPQRREYIRNLVGIGTYIFDGYCATSAERAEAFLRTLGLWK